ncbi:hypothetical protein AAEX28_04085 [Lentisphaerota bacterium WC36G]|nr:hypothetical protein LJT99_06955 [Lentisphaerae bacterium WC36]
MEIKTDLEVGDCFYEKTCEGKIRKYHVIAVTKHQDKNIFTLAYYGVNKNGWWYEAKEDWALDMDLQSKFFSLNRKDLEVEK